MKELDDTIRNALKNDDDTPIDIDHEDSMFDMVAATLRGRLKWMTYLVWFWVLVFFILTIIAAVQFFQVETSRDQLMWAVIFIFCGSAVSMMKSWMWMEMNRNSVIREVKRVELQIARLAKRIEG